MWKDCMISVSRGWGFLFGWLFSTHKSVRWDFWRSSTGRHCKNYTMLSITRYAWEAAIQHVFSAVLLFCDSWQYLSYVKHPVLGSQYHSLDTTPSRRPTAHPSPNQPHRAFKTHFKHCIFHSQEGGILGRWYITLGLATGRNEFKRKLGYNQNESQDFSSPGFLLTTRYDILQLRSLPRCYSCPDLSSCRQCGPYLDFLFW